MPPRKRKEPGLTIPSNIVFLPADYCPPACQTRGISLLSAALDVAPEFLMQHFCGCLSTKFENAVGMHSHLFNYDQNKFAVWIKAAIYEMERHLALLPSSIKIWLSHPQAEKYFNEIRACVWLRFFKLSVLFVLLFSINFFFRM